MNFLNHAVFRDKVYSSKLSPFFSLFVYVRECCATSLFTNNLRLSCLRGILDIKIISD